MSLLSPGVERPEREGVGLRGLGAGRRRGVELGDVLAGLEQLRVAVLEDPHRAGWGRRARAGRRRPRTSRRPSRRRCRSSPRGSGPLVAGVLDLEPQVAGLRRAADRSGTSPRDTSTGKSPAGSSASWRSLSPPHAEATTASQRAPPRVRAGRAPRRAGRRSALMAVSSPKARGTYHRTRSRSRRARPVRLSSAARRGALTVVGGGRPIPSNNVLPLAAGDVRRAGGDDGQISR